MYKNYIISAVRALMKSKSYTVINVSSLALGLALCMTAVAYVVYEHSWEDCHKNHDRIYRVEATYTHGDTLQGYARVMAPLGDAILAEVPGVEQVAVFRHIDEARPVVNREDFPMANLIFARPEFLDVFDVNVRVGDPRLILTQPGKVLVSDSAARMLFPGQNPIGQVITLKEDYRKYRFELEIAGVFENMPGNTQIHCDYIASYSSSVAVADLPVDRWDLLGTDLTYLLLREGSDPTDVLSSVDNLAKRRLGPELAESYSFRLKPLDDIYFETYFSGNQSELYPGGEYEIVFLVSFIALFILIQAIANFVNLSTARSVDRAREVGVRKTFGAQRSQLVRQFLSESSLLALFAFLVGLPFYELFRLGLASFLPGKEISGIFASPVAIASTFLLVLLTGLAAGLYPALYLSRSQPVTVLRGRALMRSSKSWLRRGLVVFQFAVAIVFIVTTVITYHQASFLTEFDVGFDCDNVVVLEFTGEDAVRNCALMKEQVADVTGVIGTARTGSVMGTRRPATWGFFPSPERREEEMMLAKVMSVDPEFESMFGIQVTRGRGFTADRPDDISHGILINESMVNELGLAQPLGYRLYFGEDKVYEVVGVVKDFQVSSIDYAYRSMKVIILNPDRCRVLNIKLAGDDIPATLAAIEQVWQRTIPEQSYTYSFLDDEIQASYHESREMTRMFGVLAIVSIGIACLGILGLVSYTAEQKTKEIGIRKVLGATVSSIMIMFSREFLILIGVANLVAWPGAFFLTQGFLSEFAFKISPGIGTYCVGGVLSAILALATAGYQSLKAARANPVEALRYE
ncbi:MAG: ABC transporter permease [candidate division Zixibacteria bacterium]|nr:ABC transporter permease [candidate division Zixibacteria bacterium]